jgi:single-strand DNA-binding protein
MANLNKVMLIGRLTRDPELRYIPSGAAVTEFGFAVNRYYTVNGERREDTCFLEVSAWGRLGELVKNYLRKGRQAYVEGHLTFNEWQTQDGQKRSKIRVVADQVQFLDAGDRDRDRGDMPSSERGQEKQSSPPPEEPTGFMDAGFNEGPDAGETEAPF